MVLGNPRHCYTNMKPHGGYQCGGTTDWIGWLCPVCSTIIIVHGKMKYDLDGNEVFIPRDSEE